MKKHNPKNKKCKNGAAKDCIYCGGTGTTYIYPGNGDPSQCDCAAWIKGKYVVRREFICRCKEVKMPVKVE